jgi:hypothetical protein
MYLLRSLQPKHHTAVSDKDRKSRKHTIIRHLCMTLDVKSKQTMRSNHHSSAFT